MYYQICPPPNFSSTNQIKLEIKTIWLMLFNSSYYNKMNCIN